MTCVVRCGTTPFGSITENGEHEQSDWQGSDRDRRVQGNRQRNCRGVGRCGCACAVNYSSDRKGAERVAQAIIDSGGQAIAIGADVSKAADAARLFKEVDTAFGRLDVLVNNAGFFRFGAFTDITEESFHVDYNINMLGSILTVQEAIKHFGSDGGSIINLSSIVGSHPVPGSLLYASTKGAIETLTKGLALELAPRNVRVNAIAPVIPRPRAMSLRGPLQAAPALSSPARHRSAGSVA
jgi:NAD(P)-dependent dehydrogenase (short-subunit alcohol dehydrogenase family)